MSSTSLKGEFVFFTVASGGIVIFARNTRRWRPRIRHLRSVSGWYRVGGGITPAVLPHHRTCRSASGGS